MNASVSTGVHRLPPELLLEIFSLNCPRDVSDGDLPAYTLMMKRLLVFASVCLQWREIALSAGSLWSFVCVEPKPRTLPRDMEVLAMHLKRSKDALLHLSVSAFVLKDDDWVQVWSILKLGLTRSRTLRLDFPRGRGALLDVPVPNLQTLRVGITQTRELVSLTIQSTPRICGISLSSLSTTPFCYLSPAQTSLVLSSSHRSTFHGMPCVNLCLDALLWSGSRPNSPSIKPTT